MFPVQAGGASQAGASDDGVDRAHTREGGGMAHLSRFNQPTTRPPARRSSDYAAQAISSKPH